MDELFREVEEDIRRDRLERLARKYGGVLIAAAVTVIAGTGGYVLWKNWAEAQRRDQTLRLAAALDLAGPKGDAKAAAEALATLAPRTSGGATALTRLYEAGVRGRSGEGDGGAVYDALAADGSLDPLFRDLALLMAVATRIESGEPKALEGRLAPLLADGNPWRFSARELTALLAARTGDRERARTLFQQLADDNGTPTAMRARAAELAAFHGKS
jgi:hypothetical protein